MPTDNPTLKRLKEIEEVLAHPDAQERDVRAEWLCARLRDALVYIDVARKNDYDTATDADIAAAQAAYRRLFGEEESRG